MVSQRTPRERQERAHPPAVHERSREFPMGEQRTQRRQGLGHLRVAGQRRRLPLRAFGRGCDFLGGAGAGVGGGPRPALLRRLRVEYQDAARGRQSTGFRA